MLRAVGIQLDQAPELHTGADFDQSIKLNPNDAQAFTNRGYAWRNKGDMARALADYDQAIKLDPTAAAAFYNRGNTYHEKQEFDRAIADFDQAVKLQPNYALAYYNRGLALREKGDLDRAIADFGRVVQLDASRYSASREHSWQGSAQERVGNGTSLALRRVTRAICCWHRCIIEFISVR